MQHDVLPRNPLDGVKPPRVEHQEMRFLTPREVAALADAIDERYRAFVIIGAYCGLRLGELAGLRLHRVDLAGRHLQVVEQLGRDDGGRWVLQSPKTKTSQRSVVLPSVVTEELVHHIDTWAEPERTGFVFTAPEGGHLDPDNFRSRFWAPAVLAAGLGGLRIHDLRHTTASLAIAAGADVKLLQTMLGHASAVMTLDRYGHLFPGRGREVADRLDQMVAASRDLGDELQPRDIRGMDTAAAPAREQQSSI